MLGLGGNISASAPVGVVGVSSAYYIADFNNDTITAYNLDLSIVDAEGETGVLALSNLTNSSFNLFFREPFGGILGGRTYSVTIEYFVPTESPLTDLDLYANYGYHVIIDGSYTKGQWVTSTSNFTSSNSSNYNFLNFKLRSSTDTYAGNLIYIRNVTIENVAAPPVSGLNPAPDYIDIEIESAAYPAAAYSLRTLYSFSPTYLIRVRRASDNAEQDIGFDYTGILDTSTLATFCAGTDGYVVRWYDQSSNGNDAVQTTTTNQPKIYDSSTGVVLEGGLPMIQGGQNKYLTIPLSVAAGYKVFEAGKVLPALFSVLFGGNNGADYVLIAQDGSPSTAINDNSTINELRKDGVVFAPTTRNDVYDALSSRHLVYVDVDLTYAGTELRTNYSSPRSTGMYSMHELIIYPAATTIEITQIESNINDYYSIYS